MKNRILLLIWFILLALAAVFTGAWVYAVLLLLSALAVVAFLLLGFFCGKNDHHEAKAPQSCGTGWNLEGGASDRKWLCPSGISRKRQPAFGKSFTGEKMNLPFSFSLIGKGKKIHLIFRVKRPSGAACIYATLHTWRS